MSSQLFKAAAELSDEEAQFTDFYSSSLRLPRELFQIEVLYNLVERSIRLVASFAAE